MNKLATLSLLALPFGVTAQSWYVSETFGSGGAVHQDLAPGSDFAHKHRLLPTGKLLLAGTGYDINLNSFHAGFVRLDTVCGALDTTFGNGGLAAVTFEQRTVLWNIALQPDGRIV